MCVDDGSQVDLARINLLLQNRRYSALLRQSSFHFLRLWRIGLYVLFWMGWINNCSVFRFVIDNEVGVVITAARP